MKCLITGASGFIGSRLVSAACSAFGADSVIAFSSKAVHACPNIESRSPNFELSTADRELLASVEVLIHVGAFTPKNALQANAIKECNGNISFTERLLSFPIDNVKKIIFISTLDVYEAAELTNEKTPTRPTTLYGWSKLYCERMVETFANNKNLICQILRVGHVYGPGEEKYSKFLPKAINSILAGESIELWGDGSEVRSFIYVDDVVCAIMKAIELNESAGPINVVGGWPVSIRELLDQLIVISGKSVSISARERSGTGRNYINDNTKMREKLLSEETDLITGLQIEYSYMAGLA